MTKRNPKHFSDKRRHADSLPSARRARWNRRSVPGHACSGANSPLKKCFETRFEAFSFRSSAPKRSQPAWFPSFGADDSGRGVPKGGRISAE